jgi:hypothetical protein
MNLNINDFIDVIDEFVKKQGTEFDSYAWHMIRQHYKMPMPKTFVGLTSADNFKQQTCNHNYIYPTDGSKPTCKYCGQPSF